MCNEPPRAVGAAGVDGNRLIRQAIAGRTCEDVDRELGIPEGEPVICRKIDAGRLNPAWAKFGLDVVGVAAPPPAHELAYIYAEVDGTGIRVWRVRVYHERPQAFLEARTRPGWAEIVHWRQGVMYRGDVPVPN